MDNDGDGRLELTAVATTQIDGSVTTTLTETRADGSIKARGTMTQSHDQRVTILTADTDNNGSNDWTVTTTSKIDGTVEKGCHQTQCRRCSDGDQKDLDRLARQYPQL